MTSPLHAISDVIPENAILWFEGGTQFDVPLSGNRLTDADMENSAITSWIAAGGSTLSKQTSGQHSGARCLRVAGNAGALCHQPVVTIGTTYRFRGWVRSQDGVAIPAMFNWSTFLWIGTASTSWQYVDITFTATGGASFGIVITGGNGAVEADDWDLRVVSLAQDHNFELVDSSKWSVGNVAIITKPAVSPYAGTRCLRVTYNGTLKPYAYQSLANYYSYRVTGFARGDGTFAPKVMAGGGNEPWTGTSSTSWQPIDLTFTQNGAIIGFMSAASSAGYADFDNLAVLKTNEIIDGDMELGDATKWSVNAGTLAKVLSGHSGTRCLEITRTNVNCYLYQNAATIVGFTYRLTGWARGDGQGNPKIYDSVTALWEGTTSTQWQSYDVTFTSTGILGWYVIGGNYKVYVDDVQLTLVKTTQDEDFELASTAKWLAGNSGTSIITKITSSPQAGTRCFRVSKGSTNNPYMYQDLPAGISMRVTGYARGDDTIVPKVINGTGQAIWTGTASSQWQAIDVSFTQNDLATLVGFQAATSGAGSCDFDNLVILRTNMIFDGDMELADATKWPAVTSTISKQAGTPHSGTRCLRVAYNNNANGWAYQSNLVTGFTYRHTGWARGDGTSAPAIADSIVRWTGTNSTNWQAFDATYVNGNASIQYGSTSLAAAHYVEFDDVNTILVKTTQDEDMEAADAALWTAANATLSKVADGSQHGGTKFLRATWSAGTGFYATQNCLYGGWTMRIQVWARGDGTRAPTVYAGTQLVWAGVPTASWQQCDVTVTVPGAAGAIALKLGCEAGAGYVDFDDLTVTLVNLLADGDAELMDLTKWTASNAIIAKTAVSPHGGTHALQVTGYGTALFYATQSCLYGGWTQRIQVWAKGDGTAAPSVYAGTQLVWVGLPTATWQLCDVTVLVPGAAGAIALKLGCEGATGTVQFDDLQVTLVNLLADGDAELMDLSKWPGWHSFVTKSASSPREGTHCLRIASSGNPAHTAAYGSQTGIVTVGQKYLATGWARGDGFTAPLVIENLTTIWSGTTSTEWQRFSAIFTATSTAITLGSQTMLTGRYVEFDDVRLLPLIRVAENEGRYPGAPRLVTLGDGITANTIPAQNTGKHGLVFSGTQYIDTGLVDLFERTDKFTLFCVAASATNLGYDYISSGDSTQSYRGVITACTSGTSAFVYLTNTNTTNWAVASNAIQTGAFRSIHSMCMSYNGSSNVAGMSLYLNGQQRALSITADNLTDTIKNGKPFLVGARHAGASKSTFITGIIYFVAIFPWDLTAQQIQHLHRRIMDRINSL